MKSTDTLSAAGTIPGATSEGSDPFNPNGRPFSVLVTGDCTFSIQQSLDGGDSYQTIAKNTDGDLATYNVAAATPFTLSVDPVERGALYQLDVTSVTGSMTGRLSMDFTPTNRA